MIRDLKKDLQSLKEQLKALIKAKEKELKDVM